MKRAMLTSCNASQPRDVFRIVTHDQPTLPAQSTSNGPAPRPSVLFGEPHRSAASPSVVPTNTSNVSSRLSQSGFGLTLTEPMRAVEAILTDNHGCWSLFVLERVAGSPSIALDATKDECVLLCLASSSVK